MVPLIDFRYHVITVVSIFLALAAGLLIGSTALSDAVVSDLNTRVAGLVSDKRNLENQTTSAQQKAGSDDAFIKAASSRLLTGTMTGRRLTVVSVPGTDSGQRGAVLDALETAGATVALQLQLSDKLSDAGSASLLTNLAAGVGTVPSGTSATDAGVVGLAGGTAGTVDAAVVTKVVSAYEDAGFLEVTGSRAQAGTGVVVLLPGVGDGQAQDATTVARRTMALQLARAFRQRQVPVVLAGPTSSAATGGGLAAVRTDARTGISTVDSLDTAQGPVATVLALAAGYSGKTGQYGTASGSSDGTLPAA